LETILFHNNGISPGTRLSGETKQFLISIFKSEQVEFKKVSFIFCTDDFLLKLNQQYLNQDTFTDILTFTLSDSGAPIVAEIYISVERVRENAGTLQTGYHPELFRVMIHGILHLCGYSDHTSRQKALMRKKENYYLSILTFHVERST
jgi:rRNA maturation RNase YbeY